MKSRGSAPPSTPKESPDDDPLAPLKLPADPPKPQPKWFALAIVLWLIWLAFLIVMALGW